MQMTENEKYYLRSILRSLQQFRKMIASSEEYGLGDEVLADNINWLDCFIEASERQKIVKP